MSIGLYVHYPFCPYLCNYCDYCRIPHSDSIEEKFFTALVAETNLTAREFDKPPVVDTLYIGGGTPSIANLKLLGNWLDVAKICFEFKEKFEFSFECNIDSIDVDKLAIIKGLGVTRPVLGMQSFHDDLLKKITRPHNARMGHQLVYHSHVFGFKAFAIDLLFGLPGQTTGMFSGDIGQLVDMDPPHTSLYQLTVEPNTPLGEKVKSGKMTVPDEATISAMFSSAAGTLVKSGYEHYEISSFAKPGKECRHNLNYWQGGEYLGLGPSAHSYIGGKILGNTENVEEYVESLSKKEFPRAVNESGLLKRADDTIASGLRLKKGINKQQFAERFGVPLEERLNLAELEVLTKAGLVVDDKAVLKTSDTAFFQADEIAHKLIK